MSWRAGKAVINTRDAKLHTPLMDAAHGGHLETMQILIERKCVLRRVLLSFFFLLIQRKRVLRRVSVSVFLPLLFPICFLF